MENQDFKISIKTVWVLVIGSTLLTAIGAYAKIQHWESSPVLLMIGLILFSATWIIVISDMIKNKIYNKTFWIMSMFIFPTISPLIYLIQRNKLKTKHMRESLNLTLSIFSLIYIIMLVSISYSKFDIAHHFLGAILETMTIPVILMTITLLVMNVIKWSKEKWSIKKSTFYALIALTLSIATMIIATICQS